MLEVHALWPTLLLVDDIEGMDNLKMLDTVKSISVGTVEGWDSNIITSFKRGGNVILEHKEFKELTVEILNRVEIFAQELGVDMDKYYIKINDSLVNIGKKGTFQEFHDHSPSDLSCVYYIDAREDQGDLVLGQFNGKIFKNAESTLDGRVHLPPKTGGLRVFLGGTPHQVNINNTEGTRVSIACNCDLIKKESDI
jgi:uncharacterized protein (TIGR02466 family)